MLIFLINFLKGMAFGKYVAPYRVMSSLFDKNKLVGYVLYSKPNQHCYIIRRNTFVHAVRDRDLDLYG